MRSVKLFVFNADDCVQYVCVSVVNVLQWIVLVPCGAYATLDYSYAAYACKSCGIRIQYYDSSICHATQNEACSSHNISPSINQSLSSHCQLPTERNIHLPAKHVNKIQKDMTAGSHYLFLRSLARTINSFNGNLSMMRALLPLIAPVICQLPALASSQNPY